MTPDYTALEELCEAYETRSRRLVLLLPKLRDAMRPDLYDELCETLADLFDSVRNEARANLEVIQYLQEKNDA